MHKRSSAPTVSCHTQRLRKAARMHGNNGRDRANNGWKTELTGSVSVRRPQRFCRSELFEQDLMSSHSGLETMPCFPVFLRRHQHTHMAYAPPRPPYGGPMPLLGRPYMPQVCLVLHPSSRPHPRSHTRTRTHAQPVIPVVPPPLPPASVWTEHRHDDGRLYWYNAITGKSVWEKPAELKTHGEECEGA